MKVYPRYDYAPLMTQTQLGYMGYLTTKKHLPPPMGCYFVAGRTGSMSYVILYDPAQAIHNRMPIQRRVTTLVTEMCWPRAALPLLRDLSDFLEDRDLYKDRTYEGLMNEIANLAAHFSAFTAAEIAQFAGETVLFSISPSLIHRSYPTFEVNSSEQIAIASRLVAADEKLKDR